MKTSLSWIFCAIASAILMGTIGVFSKLLAMPAEGITFFRLFFGSCFMFMFLCMIRRLEHIIVRPSLAVVINGTLLAGFIIFYVQAMNYTTMANAIMLVYLAPPVASVFAHFFMGEKLSLTSVSLIFLALFGFAMMLEFNIDFSGDSKKARGLALATAAMLCYSGFILVNRTIKDHIYCSTFYQLLIGSIVMLPFLLNNLPQITKNNCLLILCVGFFPGFLAIFLAVIALRHLRAATFGTLAYFEPLAVVIFGWTLFGEILTPLQISGCILILASGTIKAARE